MPSPTTPLHSGFQPRRSSTGACARNSSLLATLGTSLSLWTRRRSEQVGCQKGPQDRSARALEQTVDAVRVGAGPATNPVPNAARTSCDHARGTQPAVCNPVVTEAPCPSPRHLPILAAGLAHFPGA